MSLEATTDGVDGMLPRPVDRTAHARWAGQAESMAFVAFDLAFIASAAVWSPNPLVTIAAGCVIAATALGNGTYRRPRLSTRVLSETRSVIETASVPLLLVAGSSLVGVVEPATLRSVATLLPAMIASRLCCLWLLGMLRRRHHLQRRAIMVGSGEVADHLLRTLANQRETGIRIVGSVEARATADEEVSSGDIHDLIGLIRRESADTVFVAFGHMRDRDLSNVLRRLRSEPVEVFVVPRLYNFGAAAGDPRTQPCGGIPLVWLPHREWRREHLAIKRSVDLVLASLLVVITAPLMLAVAVAIKLTSPGPVIYRQTRLGRDLIPFEMLKFRSLRITDAHGPIQSGADSPHRTRVGAFLRRYSIDELPQLFNVLRGQMSLVGPRPEQPHFVSICQSIPGYADRHRVPVGMTGWAQVNKLRGARTSLADRAVHDNYYIEHWSLWLDLEILIRTVSAAARGS